MRHVYVSGMISAIWLIVAAASGVSGKPKDAARYAVLCILFLYSSYTAWKKAKKDGKKKEIDDGNDTLC